LGTKSAADATVISGDAPTTPTYPTSEALCEITPAGNGITLSGSATTGTATNKRGYLAFPVTPTYFVAPISFTESDPYGAGNPVRVDHAAGSTTGWYSGLDNGNGAPLKGYETPRGTGVSLGKFWEVAKLDWLFGSYRPGKI
jgi:hypothetical protein